MRLEIDPVKVTGLGDYERQALSRLEKIYNAHEPANRKKEKYYEGAIPLSDVNLGLALPDGITRLEIGCAWGGKTVDVLAARSMFDGYVGVNGESMELLNKIVEDNRLIAEYMKACRDELKFGCTFATLSADSGTGCKIRFHSPLCAAAEWDGSRGRIAYGMIIAAMTKSGNDDTNVMPARIYLYTETAIWDLQRISADSDRWMATEHRQKMGRPLMEPLIWNATNLKPMGRSRIKEPVRRLIDGYIRTVANATIGLEFSTTPQKYLLGITDEQYDAVVNSKFRQYVGAILAGTTNPDTGEKPTFGQLQQGTIQPHVDMMRLLATQFSAATGLPITDTGVVNDANPTSSDAILAQSQTLVRMAEELNVGNGDALKNIALMATAITRDVGLDELDEAERDIIPHFKNPAMPSVSVTADAAIKIATSRPTFAQTDTFLEMIGFSQADIRRIRSQELRARGLAVVEALDEE